MNLFTYNFIYVCNDLYPFFSRSLYEWLKTCENEGVTLDQNFTSGVRMGMGSFNLVCGVCVECVVCVVCMECVMCMMCGG